MLAAAKVVINARVPAGGSTAIVYGRVVPNKSDETVRLVALDSSGRLHRLGSAFVDSRSHYRFRIPVPSSTWRLQVRIGRTAGNAAGRSSYLRIVSG